MSKIKFPNNYENKTFLIAGAAGFVPSHVAEFYLEKGASVIGLDNFITGSRSNLKRLEKFENFQFFQCDIVDKKALPDFSQTQIDYILSLASPASPQDFKTIPLEIMRVNSEGTMNMLELAKQKKARFLEASTSEVYGDPEVHPQVESYFGAVNPIGPRAPYDESKRFAEAMCMTYHRLYGVETRIVRIFNTYGPGMRANDGRVIPNFVTQAMSDDDITVYGDGLQTRSFCYVTDLVSAMHNVLFSDDPTPFNIGNPDEYTILDCAKFIIKALNSKSQIKYLDLPKDDPKKRRPDLTKIQSISDYRPKVSFKDGLDKTVSYFKNNL